MPQESQVSPPPTSSTAPTTDKKSRDEIELLQRHVAILQAVSSSDLNDPAGVATILLGASGRDEHGAVIVLTPTGHVPLARAIEEIAGNPALNRSASPAPPADITYRELLQPAHAGELALMIRAFPDRLAALREQHYASLAGRPSTT